MIIFGYDLPDSPIAKFAAWVVGIVATTIAAWLFLVGYFMVRAEALANEKAIKDEYTSRFTLTDAQFAQMNQSSQRLADELRLQIEYSADQNAKRSIDNQLFQLEQIPPGQLRPQDRALYEKLKRDRAELVNIWNRRQRPLR